MTLAENTSKNHGKSEQKTPAATVSTVSKCPPLTHPAPVNTSKNHDKNVEKIPASSISTVSKCPPLTQPVPVTPSPQDNESAFSSDGSSEWNSSKLSFNPYVKPRAIPRGAQPQGPFSLSNLGIVAEVPLNGRNSHLKCCVIRGPNKYSIVFRCMANDPNHPAGSWADKCFFDAVKVPEARTWATLTFNLTHNRNMCWHHHNELQLNVAKYGIRLYIISCTGLPPAKENIVRVAEMICGYLNNTPGNNTTTTFDEQSGFWLDEHAVWSDILGFNNAFTALVQATKVREVLPGFYETFEGLIHSYFRRGSLTPELARQLHAPLCEIDPAYAQTEGIDDDNDAAVAADAASAKQWEMKQD